MPTITGTPNDDTLVGTPSDDSINALEGNDTLEGGLGDDLINGGDGIDTATYVNASGSVQVSLFNNATGNGNSTGADGNDVLNAIENITGSAFNDLLTGNILANVLGGGDGNDNLRGRGGNDTLLGGNGGDTLTGGFGDDVIDGGAGADRSTYFQSDPAVGGVTVSLLLQNQWQDTGSQGLDYLVGIESLSGTPFADSLSGDAGNNWLWGSVATIDVGNVSTANNDMIDGGDGNDILWVGIGNHTIIGGSGIDTLRFTENGQLAVEPGLTVSLLSQGIAQVTGNGSWTLTGIENLSSGTGDDNLTGDANANVLAGNLGADMLSGAGGNDILLGDGFIDFDSNNVTINVLDSGIDGGNDLLEGGLGNDQLYGGAGSDTASYANALGGVQAFLYNGGFGEVDGADGYDQLHDIENLTGSAFNDILGGNNLDNILSGGAGNDSLRGNAGNDQLLGGDGNDFLGNGAGDDLIDGGNGFDRVSHYTGATAGVTVDLRIQGVAQSTGQGNDTLVGIEHVSGTIFGDVLTGDEGDNWLWGSPANLGDGTISVANNDVLDGQGGNDLLTVGIGNHSINGGTGIDTLSFTENANNDPPVTISLALQGAPQATGQGSWTITNIENLSGGTGNDALTGDGNANILAGFTGNDMLVGGAGNDQLYGDGLITNDFRPTGGAGPIGLFTDAVLFEPTYVDGNDTLEGGLGNDLIDGGGGIDTASYANASGGVTVNLLSNTAAGADGNDILANIENLTGSAFTDILTGDGLDNVIIGGGGHDLLRGNHGNDTVVGGDGDDFLSGGMGDDLLDGGVGFDRVSYLAGATSAVSIDLNIQGVAQDTGGAGMDTLISIEHASGTIYNDTLTGNGGDNWLWGGSDGSGVTGNDVINAGAGNDLVTVGTGNHTLNGEAGIDTLSLLGNGTDITSAGVTFSLALQGAAQDTEQGLMNAFGFENVSGSVYDDIVFGDGADNLLAGDVGNDMLFGGAGNDTLYGDGRVVTDTHGSGGSGPITTYVDTVAVLGGISGNDTLEGGLGNDLIDGGGGIDTASYANAGGNVNVNLGNGTSSGADGNDTLVNIENVIGGAFNDIITGNGGGNVLDGLGGNDGISGGAGDDILYGGDGNDTLQGDFGDANITASGNDILYGGNGNDTIRGGLGNDLMYGGAGNDLFRGNGGVDYFDGGSDDGLGNGFGDRISFYEVRATQGVVADLRTGIISNDGFGNVETMVNIESLGSNTAYADTFYGNDGQNYLAGDRGDTVYGFGGDDLFQLTSAAALLDGGTGIDAASLFADGGWLLPDSDGDGLAEVAAAATSGWIVNLTAGTMVDGHGNSGTIAGVENVNGSEFGDTLIGDGNVNVFNGGFGDDLLEGRGGNDMLDGGNGIDTASYANAGGAVTVNLFAGTAIGGDGNDTLVNIENLLGSAFNDLLIGNNAANVIDGGGGVDTVVAFAGDDVINGNAGGDTLYGMQGNDQIFGGNDGDAMWGGTGDDVIDGGGGFNLAGFAQIQNDTVSTGVTVDLNLQGGAQNTGQGMDTLVNIQALAGTRFNDTLIGDDNVNLLIGSGSGPGAPGGDDQLFGMGGNDLLVVGSGNVLLDGGSGTDTVSLNALNEPLVNGVTVSLAQQGSAQATGSGSMTLIGIENLSGTGLSDTLTGDGDANTLAGVGGNDILVGGAGDDILLGDAIISAFSATGELQGPALILDSSVFAGQIAGNDMLEGGLGNDMLNGGGGIDTASYANAGGNVTVNLGNGTSSGADGADTLTSIENVTGGAFRDILTGDAGANVLIGGGGHDSLSGAAGNDMLQGGNGDDGLTGGAGDDVIDGGAGFDRVNYNVGATAGVTVNLGLGGPQDTGQGFDTLTNVEHVVGTVFNDVITGNAADNWLWGGSLGTGVTGNDTISGGDGNDLIEVGTGNHTLSGGNGTGDTLSFLGGVTDITSTGVAFSLATTTAQNTRQGTTSANGFENLSGSVHGDLLTGNADNNVLAGNAGNDTLNGGLGSDSLYGDGGYSTFTAGGAATGPIRLVADVAIEFGAVSGNDTLNGGDGDDFLYGGGGNDMLKGDKDNDTLYGGTGNDTLVGGQGNDRFVIEANSGADTISGFAHVDNIYFDASSGVTTFSQLTLSKVGGTSTLITWGNGNSILIDNMRPSDLTAADFSFGEPASALAMSQQSASSSPIGDYMFG